MKDKEKRLAVIPLDELDERNEPEAPRPAGTGWVGGLRNDRQWRRVVESFGDDRMLPRVFEQKFLVPGPEDLQ